MIPEPENALLRLVAQGMRPLLAVPNTVHTVRRIAFVSLLFLAGIFGVFLWARAQGVDVEKAQTMAVNTLVAMEVFYLFNVRYLGVPSLTLRGVVGTRAVLIAISLVTVLQFVFTYAPFMHGLFGARPLSISEGALAVAVGVAGFAVVEVEKAIRRRLARMAG